MGTNFVAILVHEPGELFMFFDIFFHLKDASREVGDFGGTIPDHTHAT